MNNLWHRYTKVAGLWCFCLVLSGCSGMTRGAEAPCFSCDDQRLVRIVPLTHGADQTRLLRHPFELHGEEWASLLRTVKVRSIHSPLLGASYRGDTVPLFSEEEVLYLGDSLRRAFQQASAKEEVAFALTRPSPSGVDQVTSGVWFADGAGIHLRVANCLIAVTMPSIRKQIWKDPLFSQAGAFYEFVPGEGQAIVHAARESGNPFRADPDELVIDYHGARPANPAAVSSGPSAQPVPPRSPEEQLSLLKRLLDQGLITEEDYRAKKQQVLDRL